MHNYRRHQPDVPAGRHLQLNDQPCYSQNGSSLRCNYMGWGVAILPYMEQGSLYQRLQHKSPQLGLIELRPSCRRSCNPSSAPPTSAATITRRHSRSAGRPPPYTNLANGSYKGVAGRYAYTYSSTGAITSTIYWDYASYVELLSPEPASKGILTAAGVGGTPTTTIAAHHRRNIEHADGRRVRDQR